MLWSAVQYCCACVGWLEVERVRCRRRVVSVVVLCMRKCVAVGALCMGMWKRRELCCAVPSGATGMACR